MITVPPDENGVKGLHSKHHKDKDVAGKTRGGIENENV